MFSRWGAFVYRFRRPVALITLALALLAIPFASQASGKLSSGGWLDKQSESAAVADRLSAEFGTGKSSLIALFRDTGAGPATSQPFQAAVAQTLTKLSGDSRVAGVVGYAQTHDPRFISTKGDAAYVVVQLKATDEQSVDQVASLRAELSPTTGVSLALTGYGPIQKDSAALSEKDLQRAETISLPFAALILVLVFASVVGAGMPLLVAVLAIPTSLGLIFFLAQQVEMSIYVLNISTMLGLALAIDYSLFIVSRFREELGRGRTVEEAVERAIATSGKAVAFSGFAVAIGLSGLLFFKSSALSSIGLGGSIVVLCSVFYALTFLPAVLGMLGPRVSSWSLRPVMNRITGSLGVTGSGHRWERVARAVMHRPITVIGAVLVVLLLAGSPFLHLQQGVPDAAIFPAGLESRDAYVALQTEFAPGETTPVDILVDVQGDPTSPANVAGLTTYAHALGGLAGISRVEGPFTIVDPKTGAPLSPTEVAAAYALPAGQRSPELGAALDGLRAAYIHGSTVRLAAISSLEPAKPAATSLIPVIRAIAPGPGMTAQVGGASALGRDFLNAQAERMPWAIGVTLLASAVVLFLLFGSVVIPIKAVIMTLLSISASFGALVWIFQDGNLANILHFNPIGFTIAGNPIIMFSVIFGLSMDYEVLLLSRIQESYRRTGDNTAAVADGLARTAGVITGAALIMVLVFASFALADIITIKSIGVGMAIAVFVDATIIRVLLVPATMRLMGHWNWWAPGVLGRLAERLGFSHVEDEDVLGEAPAPSLGGIVG